MGLKTPTFQLAAGKGIEEGDHGESVKREHELPKGRTRGVGTSNRQRGGTGGTSRKGRRRKAKSPISSWNTKGAGGKCCGSKKKVKHTSLRGAEKEYHRKHNIGGRRTHKIINKKEEKQLPIAKKKEHTKNKSARKQILFQQGRGEER